MIDPYSVLGVASDAEFDVLRAAYRRMVRDNHPDVASDKDEATTRMAQINEAWLMVGAPEKRANFDSLMRLQAAEEGAKQILEEKARLEAQRRARLEHDRIARGSDRRNRTTRGTKSRTKKVQAKPQKKSDVLKRTARSDNPARELRLLRKVALASQMFHREGKVDEASALCREVLLADGRNVQARELLGDVMAFQGRLESALIMFDQAIQLAPQDRMLRRKRDQLQRRQSRSKDSTVAKKAPRLSLLGRLRAKFSKCTK